MTTGESRNGRPPRPVVLCILDGWGYRDGGADNAIAVAQTPHYDRLMASCPHALIATSGADVGLPSGQMGNSEVGHMNIGAGRIVMQDLPRIDAAIADGTLAGRPALLALIERLKESGGTCHLAGLASPGGVHSHMDHMIGLAKLLDGQAIPVAIHAFLDGRDTPPESAAGFIAALLESIAGLSAVRLATVGGRYYGMDRDKRWGRVEKAWRCLVRGEGPRHADAVAAIGESYAAGTSDEFVVPTVIGDYPGMADGDGFLMANFRADRARQIVTALVDPAFNEFSTDGRVRFAAVAGMTEYSARLNALLPALFPAEQPAHTLGEIVAGAGRRQLRIAETEKYAHVTFFFNGGEEAPFAGEDRILVPSPKVATYDQQPEMSAPEVTDRLTAAIDEGLYDLIVVNFANADMVGHTGIFAAALRAVETIDGCLGRLADAVERAGGALLVTADHGNIEQMRDPATDAPYTAHTTTAVPLLLSGAGGALADGRLSDIAPTILALMELEQPVEMTGHNLFCPQPDIVAERVVA